MRDYQRKVSEIRATYVHALATWVKQGGKEPQKEKVREILGVEE